MKLFVTGAAGFIGTNYVRHVLATTDDEVTVYDALTYAGNLSSLADIADDPRYSFVQGDICDAELVAFIQWMERTARVGWLINDLRRHWLAWAGFRVLAFLLRFHPIVAHDGALSVRRAFTREDWQRILAHAGIEAELRPHFPFRWTVESCPK